MHSVSLQTTRYDVRTMLFHWATAVLIIFQWVGAQLIDSFPRELRVDARSVHIVTGVLLGLVLLARIIWRVTEGRRLPAADTGLKQAAAKATHWGLYLLVAVMIGLGVGLTWARGDNIFNLFRIPSFTPGDKTLSYQLQDLHGLVGYLILGLAGIHALAALAHRYVWKDSVLSRMLPG